MAVKSTLLKSSLSLKYKEGLDSNGKDIIKTKKFSNVKVTTEDQGVYDVAEVFGSLMQYPVQEIYRANDNLLTNI